MHYVHLTAMKSNKTKGKMCPPLPLFSLNITRKTGKTGKTGRKPKADTSRNISAKNYRGNEEVGLAGWAVEADCDGNKDEKEDEDKVEEVVELSSNETLAQ